MQLKENNFTKLKITNIQLPSFFIIKTNLSPHKFFRVMEKLKNQQTYFICKYLSDFLGYPYYIYIYMYILAAFLH